MVVRFASASHANPITLPRSASASTLLLRLLLFGRFRSPRRRLGRCWRGSCRTLLLPLVELLFLLLFLLLVALLHRRRRPHQRMRLHRRRFWLLRRPVGLLVPGRRLCVPILRRRNVAVLRLRISLLLIRPRLRSWHRLDLRIPTVRLTERLEACLPLRRMSTLIHRGGLRRRHGTN